MDVGPDPEDNRFYLGFSLLLEWPDGVFQASVPVGLPFSSRCDVHPSYLPLRVAFLVTDKHDPRPCIDCGRARLNE